MKKMLNGLWNITKFCVKWILIVAIIGTIINAVGGGLSKRAEKKQAATKNTTITSIDNTNDEKLKQNIIEEPSKETKVIITETKDDNLGEKQEKLAKKQELEKIYSYVSGPIVRNNKKYWKVRTQGISNYGLVDYDTNVEVIKPGTYDYIGNEIIIAGISYIQISTPYDNGYAYGLLNLNDFSEVIPCGVYRDVDIFESEEKVECLQSDRETIDIYTPNENTKILSKK